MLEANPGVTETPASSSAPETLTETPAPSSTPAPSAAPTAQASTPVLDPTTGQPVPPAFQPDWKYKVKDKEYEIEEWARGIAKDEETYKKLKRTFERAQGLDEVLQSRDQLKQQFESAQPTIQEYQTIVGRLNRLSHLYNTGDLDSFFGELQIPFDRIFQYVKSKHEQSQLPPEVQREIELGRQARLDAYNKEQRLRELEETHSQSERESKVQYLDSVISSKAGDVAQRFNEANGGNPEAFRNFVVFKAQMLEREMGRKPTVEEAIERTKEDVARLLGTQAVPSPTPAQPGAVGQKPPVIPNVKAGAQSPVRTPPKSIEDLKNLAKNF